MLRLDKLTLKSQETLQKAQDIADERKNASITDAHVLAALIEVPDTAIEPILQKLGTSTAVVGQKSVQLLDKLPKVDGGQLQLGSSATKVLEAAQKEADALGDQYVSCEHILIALADVKSDAKAVLTELGVTKAGILNVLDGIRGDNKVDSQDPESKYQALEKFTVDLIERARKSKLDPVIGRDDEIRRVIQVLSRRTKNNPVLIGEPGVGKTAIVEGLAQRIVSGDVPESLKNKRLLSLDLGMLIAGAKYRGEFEDRMKSVLKEVTKAEGEIVLFIDELHTLVGAGASEGAVDAANLLKPALARGELRCIGATTLDEYRKHIEKDAALERRFQQVYVGEPSVDGTIAILRGLKEKYEVHHGVKILDSAILAAANLSHRYIADRFLPDKAIDLVDEAASKLRIEIDSMPLEIDEIERKIIQYRVEMQALKRDDTDEARTKLAQMEQQLSEIQAESDRLKAIWQNEKDAIQKMQDIKAKIESAKAQEKEEERKGNYEKVSEIRFKTIPELDAELADAQVAMEANSGHKRMLKEEVDDEDISEIVAKWTGIPVTKLLSTETEKLLHIEEKLHERVIGQDAAVDSVANAIRRSRSGLADPDKPIGVFMFMGPTGVGKTELAKSLADYLFDSDKNMVRIDMSEYMEKHSVSRMVGAPPGYVGHEEGGQLTEAVRRRPYSVVLLDEVEKAHPDVFNILLQVFDDGRLTDSQGRTVDFKNTVIIMTSNVKDLKATFRPEFLNRIDDIVDFKPLSKDMLSAIVDIQLQDLAARLKDRQITLDVKDAAKAFLAESGFDADFGARPLRRTITRLVENPLAMMLLEKRVADGGSVTVDVAEGEIVLS